MKKATIFLLAALALATMPACTKMTSHSVKANLDYGPPPTNYKATLNEYMAKMENFHKYRVVKAPPIRHCAEVMTLVESEPKHGWAVDVELETKLFVEPVVGFEKKCYEKKGKTKCYEVDVYGPPILTGYEVSLYRAYIKHDEVMGMEHIKRIRTYAE